MDNPEIISLLIQAVVGLTILCIVIKFVQVLLLAEKWFRREMHDHDRRHSKPSPVDPDKNPEWMVK